LLITVDVYLEKVWWWTQ